MLRLVARKGAEAIVVLLAVTAGSSALLDLIPGSPAAALLGEFATKDQIARLNRQLGLDRPFWDRYDAWLTHALRGDFGKSIQKNEPVSHIILTSIPITLEVAILSLGLSLLIAIPLAMLSAAHRDAPIDRGVRGFSAGLLSVPTFVGCVILTLVLSTKLNWLPSFGWTPVTESVPMNLRHAALAVITLILTITPLFIRVLRADLIAVMREDYIMSARARGLPDRYIIFRHALRPASTSLFTLTGLVFGFLVGGSIILETYFSLPGIGMNVGQAVQGKDLPVIQGVVVVMAIFYVVVNGLIDIGNRLLDPRTSVS